MLDVVRGRIQKELVEVERKSGVTWIPALSLRTALLSLQALLLAPEPSDPLDAVAAQQVAKLAEMGFADAAARSALESCGGDENAALEKLC
eukprot:SM000046S16346  [mRNA]  locus=s46:57363:58191:+ [translate_table: standard]